MVTMVMVMVVVVVVVVPAVYSTNSHQPITLALQPHQTGCSEIPPRGGRVRWRTHLAYENSWPAILDLASPKNAETGTRHAGAKGFFAGQA